MRDNPCSPDRSVDGQGGRGLSSGAGRGPEWVVAIASLTLPADESSHAAICPIAPELR